jgi:hypothetical protein
MKGRFGWNFAYSGGIMRSRTEDTEGTEDFFGGLKWFYAALTSKALGRIAWMGIEDEGDLLPVPEGRSDRSLARSAWDKHHLKKSRPVGYGVIRAGMHTDWMTGVN